MSCWPAPATYRRSRRSRPSSLLREWLPALKIRVVNVVDLMTLQPPSEHPHGLSDQEFDSIFTADKPILFAFHGYPWLIHRLTYRRHGHDNLHVRGYKEEGTTTTPFDMTVLNDLDRFHLVEGVIDRVPGLARRPRTCGSACATSWSSIASTSRATARTCRRSGTGSGSSARAALPPRAPSPALRRRARRAGARASPFAIFRRRRRHRRAARRGCDARRAPHRETPAAAGTLAGSPRCSRPLRR